MLSGPDPGGCDRMMLTGRSGHACARTPAIGSTAAAMPAQNRRRFIAFSPISNSTCRCASSAVRPVWNNSLPDSRTQRRRWTPLPCSPSRRHSAATFILSRAVSSSSISPSTETATP